MKTGFAALSAGSSGYFKAASIAGLYVSYYASIASGAAIVLVATGCFLLAFLFAPGRGLVWRRA